jgi:hypothetical protein
LLVHQPFSCSVVVTPLHLQDRDCHDAGEPAADDGTKDLVAHWRVNSV